MQKYTFHVTGTHCKSCKIFIEDLLSDFPDIKNPQVDIATKQLTVESEDADGEALLARLMPRLAPNGYGISMEKSAIRKNTANIWQALPIGLVFLVGFFLLQKSGVLNLGIGGTLTPVTAFLIGIIASLSSCLAVVGGLVLSLSAKVASDDKHNKSPFVAFHAGRLIGFAVLGGALGLLGEAVGINYLVASALGIAASLVMLALGLQLAGAFETNRFTLPTGIFKRFKKVEHRTWAPVLIGVGTFFLPCGFTQSMQVAAVSSGSFLSGMLIMGAFALGTLPVLAGLSFGSASFANSRHAPLFFKSAGVVVVGLGLFSLLAGLAGLGWIPSLINI